MLQLVGKLGRESVKGWDRSSNIDRGGYLYHGLNH
jgi:hypothetical protein